MTVKLPKPIAEYFAAANTDDAERLAEDASCAEKERLGEHEYGRGAWGPEPKP